MKLDLTSVRAKITRAQEHAQSLKNEIVAWNERHPYSISTQANDDFTRYSIYIRVIEPPPITRWKLMFADSIHNLRHALDHHVRAVAIAETGQEPPANEKALQFPIEDSASEFAVVCRKRLGKISAPVVAIFEKAQPYNRPHPDLPPLLSILRDLTNGDKHRLPPLAYAAVAQGHVGFKRIDGGPIHEKWEQFAESREIKGDTEIFAMQTDRPTPDMCFDRTEFLVPICVWHGKREASAPEGSDRTDATGLLNLLSTEVRSVINWFSKV
jgi:hypothetical protein